MKDDDLQELGMSVIVGALLFMLCAGPEKVWPYCLGAVGLGLTLVVIARLT